MKFDIHCNVIIVYGFGGNLYRIMCRMSECQKHIQIQRILYIQLKSQTTDITTGL